MFAASGPFGDLPRKIQKQSWLAGVIFVLVIANVVAASYFCCWKPRKASKPDGGEYGPLAGSEPIGMSNLRRGATAGGYRDGEDDDENNADERTRLAARDGGVDGSTGAGGAAAAPPKAKQGPHPQARSTAGLGFHSGFLDDDDPMTAASARSDMATPRNTTGGFQQQQGGPVVGELISTGPEVPPAAPAVQARGDAGKGKKVESESEEESSEEEEDEEEEDEEEESEVEESGKGKGKAAVAGKKAAQESSQSLI
jgi:kexin